MTKWTVIPVLAIGILLSVLVDAPARAQDNIFAPGWTLQPEASSLRFQSVKNLTIVESSGFAGFAGEIDPSGKATLRIFLDTVDTKVDLRNVRMRFLFFETFQFPEAVVTAQIDPAALSDLQQVKRKVIPLTFTMDLHGITKTLDTSVTVTLMSDDLVAVSTTEPLSVAAADFDLGGGIKKLEEAASVVIVPSATVSFDFIFSRQGQSSGTQTAAAPATPAPAAQPVPTGALEPKGNLDLEACKGRFEILSRTDNIYFGSGSSSLDDRSAPLLNSLADIIIRCPGLVIEVGGHTDSVGSASGNQRLSERRAGAVAEYLLSKNIETQRIRTVGYGETRPVTSNDTPEGKRRNRRIEFVVVD